MNILLGSTKWLGMGNSLLFSGSSSQVLGEPDYGSSSVNGSGWRGWMFIDRLRLMEQIFVCSTIFLLAENGRMGMWIYCGGGGSTMGRLLGRMDRGSESPEHEGKYQKKMGNRGADNILSRIKIRFVEGYPRIINSVWRMFPCLTLHLPPNRRTLKKNKTF